MALLIYHNYSEAGFYLLGGVQFEKRAIDMMNVKYSVLQTTAG